MFSTSWLSLSKKLLDLSISYPTDFTTEQWKHQGRIQGGGMGGPCPPPFGTEPARNAEVCYALSARSYFDAVHISV